MSEASLPLLQMRGVVKTFPGVRALAGIDLDLRRGEVLALVGENGAGKSTLIKTLGGVHPPDEGEIRIDGQVVSLVTPADAQVAGVGVIHQEFHLVPFLSARENIYLGRPKARRGVVDRGAEREGARALFDKLGMSIDPETPVGRLSIAEQQVVEIAKALSADVRILVMDEPSATLTPSEVERLMLIIRELTEQGIGVIYISHRLDEIFDVADRVVVLRDGEQVACRPVADLSRRQLIEFMVGRSIDREFPEHERVPGAVRLEVENLCRGDRVRDMSFTARAGEVVGITGMVGSGRTELARLIFGADLPERGAIWLDGQRLLLRSPRDAIEAGICLLTEDRKQQGLVLDHSVRENFGLPNLKKFSRRGVIDGKAERQAFEGYADRLAIKMVHAEQRAGTLSGGNQQKAVLAKGLQRDCQVLLIDEPTRGIDVGARYEIYLLINELAAQGKAIIMISSEMSEVLGMCDRVLVMRAGRLSTVFDDVRSTSQKQIMEAAAH